MIAYLRGSILHRDLRFLIVDTGNVGYKVACPVDILNKISVGEDLGLWIHTVVREDAFDLYGFLDRETLEFFELLITISGIGPKSALGILSATSLASLKEAVISGETAYLTKISGIGKKIADKIVLELKDKVVYTTEEAHAGASLAGQSDVDAMEALKALGYSQKEARDALEGISRDIKDTGEKVKAALRALGNSK